MTFQRPTANIPKFSALLETVNSPYRVQLSAPELAQALADPCLAKRYSGQVWSFFTEVSDAEQVGFARAHGITPEILTVAAEEFSRWSGFPFTTELDMPTQQTTPNLS